MSKRNKSIIIGVVFSLFVLVIMLVGWNDINELRFSSIFFALMSLIMFLRVLWLDKDSILNMEAKKRKWTGLKLVV